MQTSLDARAARPLLRLRRGLWFEVALAACLLFVLLTALAMAFYPGGTALNSHSVGYHFWSNFFSDLGRKQARDWKPNPIASRLFESALGAAGAALAIFHLAFARLLWKSASRRALGADCALTFGAACGVAAGVCFIGVALNTADVRPHWHAVYVVWAFRFFLAASLLMGMVSAGRANYPRVSAWVAGVFTVLLFGYLVLIWRGPSPASAWGLMVQATAQKMIVYAALGCVGFQAWIARGWARAHPGDGELETRGAPYSSTS